MIHFLKEEWFPLVIVVVLALAVQDCEYNGLLAGPENRLKDFLLSRNAFQTAAESPIVLVEIDDAAYQKCFAKESPLNPNRLMALVQAIAVEARPRVIGVDILTDAQAYAGEYHRMKDKLHELPSKVIWASGAEKSNYRYEVATFGEWLLGRDDEVVMKPIHVLGYPPGELVDHPIIEWGMPVYPPDEDSGIRRFPREVLLSSDPLNSTRRELHSSWSRLVAEEYCHSGAKCNGATGDEVLISYSTPVPNRFRMLDVFSCPGKENVEPGGLRGDQLRERAQGRIVLVGGMFHNPKDQTSNDFHKTPIDAETPGLLVNAFAVQAEIDGSGIHEASRRMSIFFDLVAGVLLVWLHRRIKEEAISLPNYPRFQESLKIHKISSSIAASALLIVTAALLTWTLFERGYLLGFLGVALGLTLHQIHAIFDEVREKRSPHM